MRILSEPGRFFVRTRAGEAELLYRINDDVMSMFHTYVPESERGKGVAERLALEAFGFARKKNLMVRPDCSYVRHFVENHKEFSDMVIASANDSSG